MSTGPIIKQGPIMLGCRLRVKDMDPMGITRITKIAIRQTYEISSLAVYFERNGIMQCTDRWGGDGGNLTEVILKTNEYITSVNGYMNHNDDGDCCVSSLVFKTNLEVYGPYGTEKGEPFELPALGGQIIGFHAYCNDFMINALGVYIRQSNGTIMKKGPFVAGGGIMNDMDPTGITRIIKISIYNSDKIDALTVYFERNGMTQCTDRWGGDGGKLTEVILKTNEYITSVNGYMNHNYKGVSCVSSLVLNTNLEVYGPYGTEEGEPFELPALGGQIIGFHVYCRDFLVRALGVYVQQSNGTIIKTGSFLRGSAIMKDMDPTCITRIIKISIYHSDKIDALTVYFERNGITQCTDQWGGDGGKLTEINLLSVNNPGTMTQLIRNLTADEYIKSVQGYINDDYNGHEVVMSLVLETNLAVYGPFGTEQGKDFKLRAPTYSQIIGFYARCGKYVNAVGVYVRSTGSIIKKGSFANDHLKKEEMDPMGITRIVKISIYHSEEIYGLIVFFERNGTVQWTDLWGDSFGVLTEVNLKTDEYITSVNGYMNCNYDRVSSLVLETNLDVYGPYGTAKGEPFEFHALGGQIIGFHAHCQNRVNDLGVYVRQSTGTIIKNGPFLGGGGIMKHMDPTGITRIVKINIYHSDKIDALTVYFERNGMTQCTDRWGGDGGKLTEINLKTNEYIKSVKGHWEFSSRTLKSLVLETNLAVYGPYGKEEGESFERTALHGQIIGFFACVGINYVQQVGVYVQVLISKSVPCGGSGGLARDMHQPFAFFRIVKVSIRHSNTIDALSVCYDDLEDDERTSLWGGETGVLTEIDLEENEYIKSVKGYVGYFGEILIVRSLQIITDRRCCGPYGKEEGTPFELSAFGGTIIGFHGRSGAYLNAIGVYVEWPEY